MANLKYVFERIANMNYSQFFDYAQKCSKMSGKSKIFIILDMIKSGFKFSAGYADYLLFEFYRLSDEEKATYITRGVNDNYIKAFNNRNFWHLIEDKTSFNKKYNPYLGRKWCDISYSDYDDYIAFISSGKFDIFAKPIDGTCGHGIDYIKREDIVDFQKFYDRCKSRGQFLLEERLVQADEMMELYPNSVNTVRFVTMLAKNKVNFMFTCIRIGNSNFVDNLNSGGMSALVDRESGVISHNASDKDGIIYEYHPQSKTKIKGFRLPMYEQAMALVRKSALEMPELGYVGWDVAFTNKGPVLIEANHYPGHDIYQLKSNLDTNIGLKPRFDKVYREKLDEQR